MKRDGEEEEEEEERGEVGRGKSKREDEILQTQ